jgi:ankyrin repeat protein
MSAQNGQQLYDACWSRDFVRVRSLVSSGEAMVNFQNGYGATPAMACCQEGYTTILTYLLEHGANLELTDSNGFTAIHLATISNRPKSLSVLLRHGANVHMATNSGFTPLMFSASDNSSECTAILLQHDAAVDAVDAEGYTALWIASLYGRLPIVELLVEGGSDIEIANNNGKKARDIARERNHTAVVEYLDSALNDKRWQRWSGLAMVRSSIRDVEDPDRAAVIRALQCDDVARDIGSYL